MESVADQFWHEEECHPGLRLPHALWSDLGEVDRSARYLVKNTLPLEGLSLIYGAPSSGKSFFALDLAAHAALGWQWVERRTTKVGVVYVAAEGQEGFRRRVTTFRRHFDAPAAPFVIITSAVDMRADKDGAKALCEDIEAAAGQVGMKIGLVVIDTLSRCTPGAAENNNEDMTGFLANCQKIGEATAGHCMVVHHSAKANGSTPRGHSSLLGAVDTAIQVTVDEDTGRHTAKLVKQKDGESGRSFHFDRLVISLGEDDEGDKITSCVCSFLDIDRDNAPAGQAGQTLNLLRRMTTNEGQKVGQIPMSQTGLPDDAVIVSQKRFREVWDIECASGCPTSEAKRKAFNRARKKLKSLGHVDFSTKWIWLGER